MRSIEAVYLLFAVAHPVSELLGRTNLRIFLNKTYYPTDRDDFPVNKTAGAGGSLLVLMILLAPLLTALLRGSADTGVVAGLWCLALGLALADCIQHTAHAVARPRKLAPWVHLATILGALVPLLWIVVPTLDVLQTPHLWPLLLGALVIFGNWSVNSWKAQRATEASLASPSALQEKT